MKRRIYLDKLTSEDFDQYYELVGNEKVMAMITERALDEEEAQEKFEHFLRNGELHLEYGTFKIFERKTGKLLGLAKLEILRDRRQEAELGYMLKPDYWGKGFGNEITEVLLETALSDPSLKRVYAISDPQNIASRKILLKNGFSSEKVYAVDGLPSEMFGRNVDI
jgi:RimJ/RimL family protein N-acetyltransferase